MIEVPVVDAVGLRLPEDASRLRDHVLPVADRSQDYLEKFDRRTLVYDCVRLAPDTVLLICPRLGNLWPVLLAGLRVDGHPPHRPSRRVYPRYEAIRLRASEQISIHAEGREAVIAPRPTLAARFAGTRAMITMSRNNPLEWIASWLRFHVRAQGADAVLFQDNGSDTYTMGALADVIAAEPGLRAAAILRCPYPYGPIIDAKRAKAPAMYLQSAMLNLARLEALSRATAVLNVDIDELVTGPQGHSVFDAAARSRLGVVNIGGSFAFPPPGTEAPAGHRAHRFCARPDRASPRKWCATPRSPLSRMGWFVHQVGGEAFKLVRESRDFRLIHCAAANPRWPNAVPAALVPDPALAAALEAAL